MPAEPFKRYDRPNEHTPSKGPKIPLPDENIDRSILESEDIVLLKPADIDVIQASLIKVVRRVAMTLVCAMVAIMCAMVLPSMLVAGGSPGAYVIGVLLAVSIGLAAVGPAMFLVGLGRLPKNEQVDLKELSERSDLSSVSREDWPDAMDKLRQYLEEYPVPDDLMTDDDKHRLE
jgi:hypothetical protein